jgi:hypothetical protein
MAKVELKEEIRPREEVKLAVLIQRVYCLRAATWSPQSHFAD